MPRRVKPPAERRRDIVLIARKLFLEQTYENTAMSDVTQELQIAKGTVYHYFKSKEELLDCVVDDIVDEYVRNVQTHLDSKMPALKQMCALITAGRVAETKPELIEQLHASGNMRLHTRLLAVTVTRLAPLYADVIQRGCQEGVFRVEHPLEAAELVLAGLQFLTDAGCYPWAPEVIARRLRAIPGLVEAQLGASKGTFSFLQES